MRAPDFWWKARPSPLARVLSPLGALYGAVTASRMARTGHKAEARVICIGNLVAGGAGKTPVALAVGRLIGAEGKTAFLTRGYGGSEIGPLLVDPALHEASRVGDEPLLLARLAPTVLARDRRAGAMLCETMGVDTIIMDDGLQNPSVLKDIGIAVVDGAVGIGNGLCIPAGPLRAPVAQQWPFVAALVILGTGEAGDRVAAMARNCGAAVHRGALVLSGATIAELSGKPVLAFAGIGRPEKFFASLREAGVEIADTERFADHHMLSEAAAEALLKRADREHLSLVTTEKDKVRLRGMPVGSARRALHEAVRAIPVAVTFEDECAFKRLILMADDR